MHGTRTVESTSSNAMVVLASLLQSLGVWGSACAGSLGNERARLCTTDIMIRQASAQCLITVSHRERNLHERSKTYLSVLKLKYPVLHRAVPVR